MFIVEILLTTSLSSIVGYVAMTILLLQIQAGVGIEIHIVYYTFISFSIGFVGLYLLNIVFGLIPINMLLQKTPSEIMKKYDL